ncbi:hypothetical protein KPP2018_063 [Klebsiella phage KPP2018]|uniref:Uncharacterized protein n=1 Tax=Klebsiella phage KPP2018 TaxID=3017287 RepID=A0AAE9VW93_9CAUD|nr:hypothetical protein KPP2018_063 [Klebsiella phage KPP2018]
MNNITTKIIAMISILTSSFYHTFGHGLSVHSLMYCYHKCTLVYTFYQIRQPNILRYLLLLYTDLGLESMYLVRGDCLSLFRFYPILF